MEVSIASMGRFLFFLVLCLLPARVQLKAVAGDLPLPKRCHLVAPCSKQYGCQPDLDSKEIHIQGRKSVQLGVVCISSSGSHAYGTGGFFTYTIWEEGSNVVFSSGKFNQYDVSLKAHLSGMMELPMGIFTVSVVEGQLENKRKAIADGKPYRVHAVLYSPHEPTFMLTPNPQDRPQPTETPEGPLPLPEGDLEPPPLGPVMGNSSVPDEAVQVKQKGNKIAMIVVGLIAIISFSVLIAGVVIYLRGKDSPPIGFALGSPMGSPNKMRARKNSDPSMDDPEMGGADRLDGLLKGKAEAPDFSDSQGPRRPARGKRAKKAIGNSDGGSGLPPEASLDESSMIRESQASQDQSLRPGSASRQMVTINGPIGQDGMQVSAFTAKLLAKHQALPGMPPPPPPGDGSRRINWSLMPPDSTSTSLNPRLAPLAMDEGTDERFTRRYHEIMQSHDSNVPRETS